MTTQEAVRREQQSKRDREAEQNRRDQHLHAEAVLRPRAVAGRKAKPRDSVGIGHNRGPPLDDGPVPGVADDHRVLSFRQWCELNGFSPSTGRRIIGAGNGPIITQLSSRRIGITIRNNAAWQQSRARGAV
jgi:hypothetical protein